MDFFDKKLPLEKNVLTFNMAAGLTGAATTLSGAITVTVTVYGDGIDTNPSAILNGAAGIDTTGTLISIPVQGGLQGVQYLIEVECGTNSPSVVLGKQAVLPIGSPE
jgi:hypothetical protein